jgi:hypothetical protein
MAIGPIADAGPLLREIIQDLLHSRCCGAHISRKTVGLGRGQIPNE